MVVDDQLFKQIVKNSNNISDVLRKLELPIYQGNYLTVKRRINLLGIDTSHFSRKVTNKKIVKYPNGLADILVQNSTYATSSHLKNKLIKMGILANKCSICGQQPIWKGKPMIMILDHINGVHTDNRLENLRLVCPNCNSQLDTNCGKNIKNKKEYFCTNCHKKIRKNITGLCINCLNKQKHEKSLLKENKVNKVNKPQKKYICTNCHKKISKNVTGLCQDCFRAFKHEKSLQNLTLKKVVKVKQEKQVRKSKLDQLLNKLTLEQIKSQIEQIGYQSFGKQFDLTCNAVKRWCKKNNILLDEKTIKQRRRQVFLNNIKDFNDQRKRLAAQKRICACGNKKQPFAQMCRQCWLKQTKQI